MKSEDDLISGFWLRKSNPEFHGPATDGLYQALDTNHPWRVVILPAPIRGIPGFDFRSQNPEIKLSPDFITIVVSLHCP